MKINFWSSLSSRKRKLIYWVLGLWLFYTVFGFLILPPIVRAVAVKQLSSQLDRKVSIQQVKINPYVFSTTIRGLYIEDKDGEPFISWDEVYVNFQITSIFRKEWTFAEIRVVWPYVRAQMNKDYTLNFSDLIQKFSTNAPETAPKAPSKPLLVHVRHLQIIGARLSLADFTVRTPFKRIIGPLDFNLDNFHTAPDINSPYSFAGTTDAGELFSWRGYVCLDPLRSDGELTVDHVTLNKFAPLYQDIVNFKIRSGQFGVHADYRFEISQSNRVMAVTNAAYALRNFRLADPDSTNDIVELRHLSVTGASADLETHHAEVGRIAAMDAKLFLERNKNKSVNVAEIAAPSGNAGQAGVVMLLLHSITNEVEMLLKSTNEWTGIIHEVDYTNCAVHLQDFANARPASLDLDDINFTAKNISNLSDSNLTAALSMRWNTNGSVNVLATAGFAPLTVDMHFAFDNLGLNTLDPYLESQFNLLIPEASFGLNGDFHVRTETNGLPNATFHGDTWFNDFRAVDGVTAQDLLKWGSLHISGMDASLNPEKISIQQISINNASAQLIIETNKTINLLLALQPATPGAEPTNSATVLKKPAETNQAPASALPPISIAQIVVTNTQIRFIDRSLKPNVNMAVEQAGGAISGISTSQLQHGDIDLHALVDGVGPVQITGQINPFSGAETNVLNIFLTNMDLLPTSPYSGKFAGYRIARGNLSLDLKYRIVGRNVKSQNIITIDQFNFGDKVDSPDATKLPVRLGVAILKDREGKIVLDVPVEGNLDDPRFRIHKVVMRAIVDILTKVATSPFALLGAAFGGGGEELSYEEFVPGVADVSDASKKKLDTIDKALYDRPALRLQLSGSIDPVNDRDALQRTAFEQELRTRQWNGLSKSKRETITPDQIILTPEERTHWVKKLYNEALSNGKISSAVLAAHTNLAAIAAQIKPPKRNPKQAEFLVQESQTAQSPQKAAAAPAPEPSKSKLPPITDPKEALLVAIMPVSDSDLEALAINRAKAVRAYILASGKVEADRIFLEQNQTGGLRQDGSRVYLQLD
jgi:Domain of Unknown Function (DUF748)